MVSRNDLRPDTSDGVSPIPENPIPDLFDISGVVACVTGVSSGLGQAFATVLHMAGARVVGVARREEELKAWQGTCGDGTAIVVANVSDLDNLHTLATTASIPFGAPDILVNAAGINDRQPASDVTPERWQRTLDTNLSAPFFLAQALIPAMQEKGWGRIVNVASLQSTRAFADSAAYGASKGGIAQLTRAMADAWSKDGINANALAPGFFPTELTKPVFENATKAAINAAQTCIGRNGRLNDLNGPLLFLCSRASDYVTGQVLFVDGGFTAR